jgi:hypothetical protein
MNERPCVVCRRPTRSVTCSSECWRVWRAYIESTPLPPRETESAYAGRHDGPEDVNETGDYQPPVRKPRTRK